MKSDTESRSKQVNEVYTVRETLDGMIVAETVYQNMVDAQNEFHRVCDAVEGEGWIKYSGGDDEAKYFHPERSGLWVVVIKVLKVV